ncbi:MAG: hypothetical protein Fur0022_38450 [Anaerolineales bacterium]
MSDENLNETQPMQMGAHSSHGETMPARVSGGTSAHPDLTPSTSPPPPARKRRLLQVGTVLFAWILLFAVVALTGYWGYNDAIAQRISEQSTQAVLDLDTQYELGIQEYATGEYARARQRFEYILSKDPNYAKAIEMLARTIAVMEATATPTPLTPTPTPTLTPTPDLRAVEEIFTSARAAMEAEDWNLAISTLLGLRQKDPAYRAVEVDSMLYVAFRYRGVDKILRTGEIEGGLLDLGQAELFGPLDAEAQSFANFASLFVIGVSFWEVDWAQAAYYFGQVAPYLPNLHNGDNWLASQRYVEALQHYIDQLIAADNYCEALIQMEALRAFSPDPVFEPTQIWIDNKCNGGGNDDEDEDEGESSEATPIPPEATPIPAETTPAPEPTTAPEETPTP